MNKLKPPKRRNVLAADLRTPKYRLRVVTDKKKATMKKACRNKG